MSSSRTPEDFFAKRVREAKPSPTLAVSEKARQLKADGVDVIDLGGGDPDFITPEHVRQAASDSMNAGNTHYVAGAGIPELRNAIATKLHADNGIHVDPNTEVFVTPGGKSALYLAAQAFIEPGVDVMVLEPAWVSYVPIVELAGGTAIHVGLDPDDNYRVTTEVLEQNVTPDTRILMMNSPNNPTGRVLNQEELHAIANFAVSHDILVWTDEIYEKILYGDSTHHSLASLPRLAERSLTFSGLSKAYAMTGWRLGYVAGPGPFIKQISTINSHAITCATSFAQAGGAAALTGSQEFVGEMLASWDRRRQLVTDGLNNIKGLRVRPIEGAFYAFVDAREQDGDSVRLAARILDEANVAVVPGIAFGESGEGHFRLSFATGDAELKETIIRLSNLFGSRR